MNTGNIVMWEILHSIADWDCSRILALLGTQNRHREELCENSGVQSWFPQVGCARNKLQFHTVLLNLR